MRLINADALKKDVLDLQDCYNGFSDTYDKACIIGVIDEQPTIKIERKKGQWLDGHRTGYGESLYWYIYCSECLCERDDDTHDKDTPYCPYCGADMRGDTE